MGVRLKIGLSFLVAFLATSFTNGQQRFDDFQRPSTFTGDPYNNQDISFYNQPSDQFWNQFFDVYNYNGPLEQDPFFRPLTRPPARPIFPNFDIQEQFSRPNYQDQYSRPGYQDQYSRPDYQDQYSRPDYQDRYTRPEYFGPQRETFRPIREEIANNVEDAYNRYRSYFFRRFGTNFVDTIK